MNVLVDDKDELDIVDLCNVHLGIDIDIQHPMSQLGYYEGPIDDEEDVNQEDIVNLQEEDLIAKIYEQVFRGEL